MTSPRTDADLRALVERASSRGERLDPLFGTSDAPLPAWTSTLLGALDVAAALANPSGATADRALASGEVLPFEEIVLPFVIQARAMLPSRVVETHLSPAAWATLERALLRQLVGLFMRPLYAEFAALRATRRSAFSRLLAREGSDSEYRAFVARMHSGGLALLLAELPVLARAAAQATDQWLETTVEFLGRLAADRTAIAAACSPHAHPGEVVAVMTGLSDAHHGGRTVAEVRFASGLRVIYKSRDVGIEQAFFALLAWLNGHSGLLPLRELLVLERPGYGWLEFVDHLPCTSEAEADRYFRRAGMLLALVYALGGDDCHGENVIASGEHPVLVDLETIMRPIPPDASSPPPGADAQFLARLRFQDSVLGTGFLPRWETDNESGSIDVSGLGGEVEQTSIDHFPRWANVNTDRMSLEYALGDVSPAENVLRLGDRPLPVASYADSLIEGFRSMYSLILSQRDAMLAPDGPLGAFANHTVRFVLRSTHVYARTLEASLDPAVLHDGARRSMELDVLRRSLGPDLDPRALATLHRAEQAALESFDVPHFSTSAASRSLTLGDGLTLVDYLEQSPFDRSIARIRGLDRDDLDVQVAFIRAALLASVAVDAGMEGSDDMLDDDTPMSREDLISAVRAIATQLHATAIRSPNGSASWIGLGFLPLAQRFQLQPIRGDLYSGVAGIAVFLAALEQVTGEAGHALALSALLPLRRDVSHHGDDLARSVGIGGATGLGSIVYGFVHTARLLRDPSLLEDARSAAALISLDLIASDVALDVIAGAAGALLGLLALHDATPEPWVLERAIACGEHLVRQRIEMPDGRRVWQTIPEESPLTGFAHGAAGIAYALLRLSAQAGPSESSAFEAAAIDGIAYEQSLFVQGSRNWPDVREPLGADGQPVCRTAWCHGAPGIALARLGGLASLDTPGVRADVDAGLETTLRFGVGAFDHLCCGGAGRIDALIEGARRLHRPELLDAANRLAARMVRRARRASGYATQGGNGSVSPGLFHGTAGIGYTLLRLIAPDALPSVLLWE